MKNSLFSGWFLLFLAGCQSIIPHSTSKFAWEKKDGNDKQFNVDSLQCRPQGFSIAASNSSGAMSFDSNPAAALQRQRTSDYESCLQQKGYAKVRVTP